MVRNLSPRGQGHKWKIGDQELDLYLAISSFLSSLAEPTETNRVNRIMSFSALLLHARRPIDHPLPTKELVLASVLAPDYSNNLL